MTTQALRFVKQHYLRLNFSNLPYQLFLLFLGIIVLFLIIFVKSKTATEFWSDPLLFFYTIFVTTFQLSRIVGAMFYKHSASKVMQGVQEGGGIMSHL